MGEEIGEVGGKENSEVKKRRRGQEGEWEADRRGREEETMWGR